MIVLATGVLLALLAALVLLWVARRGRGASGPGECWTCGSPAGEPVGGKQGSARFCSEPCRRRFLNEHPAAPADQEPSGSVAVEPAAAAEPPAAPHRPAPRPAAAQAPRAPQAPAPVDPVCGAAVTSGGLPAHYAGRTWTVCSPDCLTGFEADPLLHLDRAPDAVCGRSVSVADAPARAGHAGREHLFCSTECREQFEQDPERHLLAAHSRRSGSSASPASSR